MAETQRTAIASAILGIGDQQARKDAVRHQHALFREHEPAWTLMADAYEGDGGFLTGAYLWKFPAEVPNDYNERKDQARYHNYVETLVDIYVRYVCAQVTRTTTDKDLEAWWADVDGAGTSIADFVRDAAAHGLVQGHCGALVDMTPDEPTGPAKADQQARVIATLYPANSILDWRMDRRELVAVKLSEAAKPTAITDVEEDEEPKQYLFWTADEWARFDQDADLVSDRAHDLGLVPLALLRPKASKKHAFIGRPLLGNANVVRALYNRSSEEDHVMRGQGFSLLTVQLPADATAEALEHAKAEVGANYGVARALVTVGSVNYVSPEMAIPGSIRENIQFLIRELFRAAHVTFASDSRDAESGEALQIKHAELTEMLRNFSATLSAFEQRIARIWFGWQSATPEQAEKRFEAAKVTAQYPHEFILKDLEADLRAWAAAVRFSMPPEFVKRLKKRIVRRIEPDIPADVAKTIDDAIDTMKDEPQVTAVNGGGSPEDLRARAAERLRRIVPPVEGEAAA
jgi:hypothetical protein